METSPLTLFIVAASFTGAAALEYWLLTRADDSPVAARLMIWLHPLVGRPGAWVAFVFFASLAVSFAVVAALALKSYVAPN